MSNYATKKELKNATGIDIFNLASKRDFVALKALVNKIGSNKLINVPCGVNNLKTKVDDFDDEKVKNVPLIPKKCWFEKDNWCSE